MHGILQAELAHLTSKTGAIGEGPIMPVLARCSQRVWAHTIIGATTVAVASAFDPFCKRWALNRPSNTDGGGLCSSSCSKLFARQGANHRVRPTEDRRYELATLDSALGTIKQGLETHNTTQQHNDVTTVLDQLIR